MLDYFNEQPKIFKIMGEKQRGGLVGFERFWAMCLITVLLMVLIATFVVFKYFHKKTVLDSKQVSQKN